MNDIESVRFTTDDFDKIWAKRSKRFKTCDRSEADPCFDYYTTRHKNNYFKQGNWNDPAISDFMSLLFDLDIDEIKQINNVRIQRLAPNVDESRYIIQNDIDVYVLSQYKSQGNIKSFVATDLGTQIHVFEFVRLLIDLGLERL